MIALNYWLGLGFWCAAISLALAAWLIGERSFRLRIATVHPGWWVDVLHGDCGFLRRDSGFVATLISVGLVAHSIWSKRKAGPGCAENIVQTPRFGVFIPGAL